MFPHNLSHAAWRWCFWNSHTRHMHISSFPSVTVEAMNNTSFIILLQEICNTWNRMQYAVYLHAWQTQGASVVSVFVTRREGKKRGEQRKQVRVTPDSPSASCSNYSPGWGVGCWGWWRPSCLSPHLNKGCVIFNVSVCCGVAVRAQRMYVTAHAGVHLVLTPLAKIFAIYYDYYLGVI